MATALGVQLRYGLASPNARSTRAAHGLTRPRLRAFERGGSVVANAAAAEPQGDDDAGMDYRGAAARLNAMLRSKPIDAAELRALVLAKWGRAYDIRLLRRANKMYCQIMWKWLGMQSFHLTEDEYMTQLDAVAHFLNQWGVADTVRNGIQGARARGPGYTGGTSARCVSIPLDVDLSGARSGEWN